MDRRIVESQLSDIYKQLGLIRALRLARYMFNNIVSNKIPAIDS